SIRRICASLSRNGTSTISASSTLPLNQPIMPHASNLIGPEPSGRTNSSPLRLLAVHLNVGVVQARLRSMNTLPQQLVDRLELLSGLTADAWQIAGEQAASIIADTERALKRAIKRAEELDAAWERVEFVPTSGPTVEMTARLLAEQEFDTRGELPLSITMQIWETKAGALVAVDETRPLFEDGTPKLAVRICQFSSDAQAQRFAVMEHFAWNNRARSMARKLGWSLRVEVP
ncbi:hypothetical protein ACFOD9_10070, partial [Novosphingobium bradum]